MTESLNLGEALKLGAGESRSVAEVYDSPAVLVNVLLNNLFIIGGILLFVMTIFAGFKFIQSGTKGRDESKSIATAAVGGFIIMFAAYWVVKIVEVLTGMQLLF